MLKKTPEKKERQSVALWWWGKVSRAKRISGGGTSFMVGNNEMD
jgi:hypothetical protein